MKNNKSIIFLVLIWIVLIVSASCENQNAIYEANSPNNVELILNTEAQVGERYVEEVVLKNEDSEPLNFLSNVEPSAVLSEYVTQVDEKDIGSITSTQVADPYEEPDEDINDEPDVNIVDEPEVNIVDEPEEKIVEVPDEDIVDEPNEELQYYYFVGSTHGSHGNPDYSDVFPSDDSLERYKAFNSELKEKFMFYELHTQSLDYIGYYDGDVKFTRTYDMEVDTTNQIGIDDDGDEFIVTALKTIMIGKNVYPGFNDRVLKGRNFTDVDFAIHEKDQTVNIILGYEYFEMYDLDDIIPLYLYTKRIDFRVIGFFEDDTSIRMQIQEPKYEFNRAIIVPLFDILYAPSDAAEDLYQKRYYSAKSQGYIEVPDNATSIIESSYEKYQKTIEERSESESEPIGGKLLLEAFGNEVYNSYFQIVEDLCEKNKVYYVVSLMPTKMRMGY